MNESDPAAASLITQPDPKLPDLSNNNAAEWLYHNSDRATYSEVCKPLTYGESRKYPGRCVYWLELNGMPMYVGQTHHGVRERMKWHRHTARSPLHDLVITAESMVYWIEVSPSSSLTDLENFATWILSPKLNIERPKNT